MIFVSGRTLSDEAQESPAGNVSTGVATFCSFFPLYRPHFAVTEERNGRPKLSEMQNNQIQEPFAQADGERVWTHAVSIYTLTTQTHWTKTFTLLQ